MATTLLKDHDALFLHLPKTAGYSLSSALADLPGAEPLPVRDMTAIHGAAEFTAGQLGPDVFVDLYSFAVVRNPWDWAVSGWKHVTENTRAYPRIKPDFVSFLQGDWQRGLSHNPNPKKFASPELFVLYHCFVTQWDHLCIRNEPVPLSFTIRFEHLQDDLAVVERHLGISLDLPHRNRSERTPYRQYYTDSLRTSSRRQTRRSFSVSDTNSRQ